MASPTAIAGGPGQPGPTLKRMPGQGKLAAFLLRLPRHCAATLLAADQGVLLARVSKPESRSRAHPWGTGACKGHLAPVRFAPVRFAPARLAPVRFAERRLASVRSS